MLAALEADRVRVADLQTHIVQLERAISQLRLEQWEVQQRLDAYRYPVLTLPNELVSEIFVQALPPYPKFPQLVGPFSPNPLAQICRSWREIALGTPKLWSAISLPDVEAEWELLILQLWLKRSLYRRLSIEIGTAKAWADVKIVEAIVPHRARWEYLKINLAGKNLQFLEAPMPLLRHLELKTTMEDRRLDPIAAHGVPLLRTVVLNDLAAKRIMLPWMQLTSLTLIRVYPSECIPILVQTRNLVHCELHVLRDSSSDVEPHRDLQLQCLESLVFILWGTRPVTDFLPIFIVPALRSLTIPEDFLTPKPFDLLTAFISKSGCTLEKLHLTGTRTLSEKSYRQAFPSLRLSFSR
ncbi:hypothetical protein DFH06DRAFT_1338209 [Mycena polygramma]|nr:hypothetical protein DFH06DRAFT_1338209 [Mycena polygramma]